MKSYASSQIRNICLAGPHGAGKTSLVDAVFFKLGKIPRKGEVVAGNTISDFTEEEIERKISVHVAVASAELERVKINFIDTPGYSDFAGEFISGAHVSENAFVCVAAEGGLENLSADTFVEELEKMQKPAAIVLTKIDKENLDFDKILSAVTGKFGQQVAPLYVPVECGGKFDAVIDLLNLTLINTDGKTSPLDDNSKKRAAGLREKLVEAAAAADEKLTERYLNGEEIKTEELAACIKSAYAARQIFPLLCISSQTTAGLAALVNFASDICIAPTGDETKPFSGIIFKSTSEPGMGHLNYLRVYNGKIVHGQDVLNYTKNKSERIGQISVCLGKKRTDTETAAAGDIVALSKLKETKTNDALGDPKHKTDVAQIPLPEPLYERAIASKNKGDEEKIGQALSNALLEHPTVKQHYRAETKEMILSGVGNLQLDIIAKKVKTAYHVETELKKPRVPYKETVAGTSHVQGKYKRQSGGRGQYGDCWLAISPKGAGGGYEFADKIVGGVIPKNYIPSIEKGVKEAMEQGVIAGYPVVNIKVTVDDGSYHEVDSSDMAFKIAGAMALRKGVIEAKPYILEPILDVTITIPEEFMGAVMGDLNSKRGKVLGMDRSRNRQIIKAQVPWGEMFEYLIDLKSLTRGTGKYSSAMSHYEMAPPQVAQPLIEAFAKSKTAEE